MTSMSKPRVIILTAWDEAFSRIGKMSVDSTEKYCIRTGMVHREAVIPEDYDRHPSWFKVDLILEYLPKADYILWMDADTLLIDSRDIRDIIEDVPLNIARDANGENCGVMAWKNCEESLVKLHQINDAYEEFKDHKWWEQGIVQRLIRETPKCNQWWFHQPKQVWNAYTDELCPETRIIHYPGFSVYEKTKLMEAQKLAIKRNGHGLSAGKYMELEK